MRCERSGPPTQRKLLWRLGALSPNLSFRIKKRATMKVGGWRGCASFSSDMTESSKLFRSSKETFEAFTGPNPAFSFKIGWSRGYDSLLRGEVYRSASYSDLYREARLRGRVILCAQ